MFSNYLKIAWRNLTRSKLYSVINILGLAAGMAVAMLIGFWIWDEVNYDTYSVNHKHLAQVMTTETGNDGKLNTYERVCQPLAEELRTKYASDFKNVALTRWNRSAFAVGDKTITSIGWWAEDKLPVMFSLHMLEGNSNGLNDPSSIIINASMAKTLFGNADAINKTIKLDNKDNYKVAGVFRDFSDNSTLSIVQYFLPWKKYISTEQWVKESVAD